MDEIINHEFKVGDRFEGMVNGEILRVTDVREPGIYPTPWGGQYEHRFTTVWFENETTGKRAGRDLRSAQRLLLQKVS